MKKSLSIITSSVLSAMLFLGCGGSGDNNTEEYSTITGKVVDGYIENAQVCLDLNINFRCDYGEPVANTDRNGNFELKVPIEDTKSSYYKIAPIISKDGFNTVTGERAQIMATPRVGEENVIITPLTTLLISKIGDVNYLQITKEDLDNYIQELANDLNISTNDIFQDPQYNKNLLKLNVMINSLVNILSPVSPYSIGDELATKVTFYEMVLNKIARNESFSMDDLDRLANVIIKYIKDIDTNNFSSSQIENSVKEANIIFIY